VGPMEDRRLDSVFEYWTHRIERHPLHAWLEDFDDDDDPSDRLAFALYFLNFIMYFRELNLYHIKYESPSTALEEALRHHALEDHTHSRLFMLDVRRLGWSDKLQMNASQTLYWLFTDPANEGLRRRTTRITKAVIGATSPAVRHAVVEAIEICGNALFRHTQRIAETHEQRTGVRLLYWGQHHLERESGHAIEVTPGALDDLASMTDEEVHLAISLATDVFEVIEEQNSAMLLQATTARSRHGLITSAAFNMPDIDPPSARLEETPAIDYLPSKTSPHQHLVRHLDDLRRRIAQHPVLHEVRQPSSPDETSNLLRLALLSFATDSTGTSTVYSSMVSYRWPVSDAERAINRLCSQFGRRTQFVYVDWHQLDLDRVLGWDFGRTLDFIYLDRYTEPYRDLRAVITHYIDRYDSPAIRYWVIVALKSLSAVYADAFCSLARNAETTLGIHLPYLALWANPSPAVLNDDPDAANIRFDHLGLSNEEMTVIEKMLNEVALGIEARLDGMTSAQLEDVMSIESVH